MMAMTTSSSTSVNAGAVAGTVKHERILLSGEQTLRSERDWL